MTKTKLSCFVLGAMVLTGVGAQALAEQPSEPVPVEVAPADFVLEVGEPIYIGSGCPEATAHIAVSQERQRMLVGFDVYTARADADSRFDRAACSLAVPVSIPPGVRVSLSRIRLYGYADIPENGRGRISAEYFFAGSVGPTLTQAFPGGFAGRFRLANDAPVRSSCGEDGLIRVNTSIIAEQQSQQAAEEAFMAVDLVTLQITAERCSP